MMVMTLAMAAGPLLLNLGSPKGFDLFILASVLVSVAMIPVALTAYAAPRFEEQERFGLRQLAAVSPLGVAGSVVSGATAGALVSLAAVHARVLGLTLGETAWLSSAAIVGGMALLWPAGRLSDRFDRRLVLTGVALAGGGVLVVAALLATPRAGVQIAAVATVGAFVAPLYSLSVAHTNDRLQPSQLVAASSGLLLANGVGGMAGPSVAGLVMETLGPPGFFWFPAGAMLLLAAFAVFRMTRRAPVPGEKQRDFVQMPRTSGVIAEIALRDRMDRDLASIVRR